MNNKHPTDAEKLAVIEDYTKSLNHLKKLGLVQLIDGGVAVRVTPLGLKVMAELEKQKK